MRLVLDLGCKVQTVWSKGATSPDADGQGHAGLTSHVATGMMLSRKLGKGFIGRNRD